MESYWSMMRERRTRWLGSINVVHSTRTDFIENYFKSIRERFFTGRGGYCKCLPINLFHVKSYS